MHACLYIFKLLILKYFITQLLSEGQTQLFHNFHTKLNTMEYKRFLGATFEDIVAVILFSQIISSVQTDHLQIDVTRQINGDTLTFEDKVDCVSLNAQCLPKNKHGIGRNICDSCKCLSSYTTYVSIEKQCININGIPGLNCRTLHKQMPVLDKLTNLTISGPILAYRCKIKEKERNPEVNSGSGDTWSWVRMKDVDFSLRNFSRNPSRLKNWQVKFKDSTISKMLSKYVGRIVKLQISCKMRWKQIYYTDLCMIFKIAGSFVGNSTTARHPYDRPYSHISSRPTTIETTISSDYSTISPVTVKTSDRPSEKRTVGNQEGSVRGKSNQIIWIIIPIVIVIVVILIAVLFFICYKTRKTIQSNAEYPRRDIVQHEYDIPVITKPTHNEGQGNNQNTREEHFYETFSEMPYANSSACNHDHNLYQELNHRDREKYISHYQPLIKPAERVHTKPDGQTRDTKPKQIMIKMSNYSS